MSVSDASSPDRLRLVMPPVLFSALSIPFTLLAHALFTAAVANGIIAGAFVFCTLHHYIDHDSLNLKNLDN